jgi:hypothetical protein
MALTDDLSIGCSYLYLSRKRYRRRDHLSQVWTLTSYDDLWVAPLGRIQTRLVCRGREARFYPCNIASCCKKTKPTFWCNQSVHPTSHSRLSLVGRLSPHRVDLNDPSNRAFLRHPVSSLASKPSEEREFSPLVHIVQAALSPPTAQPEATPVAIRLLGESLNPTKEEISFASDSVSSQVLVAPFT